MNTLKQRLYALLRQSEQFFKTDMVYLAHGSFWLTFGQILGSLSSFGLAIILARYLTKDMYGTYKYILSIAGTLTIFSLKGMDASFLQAAAHGKDGSFFKVLRTKISFGLIGSLVAFGLSIYYFLHHNTLLAGSFGIAGLFVAYSDPLFLYDSLLQGKQQFKLSALYSSLSQIFTASVIAIAAIVSRNIFVLIFVYFAAWTLARFIALRHTIKKVSIGTEEDPRAIGHGIHTSIISTVATLSGSLDNILIYHYLGPVHLAIYTFALAPISQIRMFTDKIPTLAMPRFARRSIPELKESLGSKIMIMAGIAITITAIYILCAPLFFNILFPQYMDSVNYSRLYALILLIYTPYSLISATLSAKLTKIPPKLLYLWNIPTIVTTVSVIFLVVPFGIVGAISARLISAFSVVLVGLYLWYHIRRLPETVTGAV